MRLSNLITSRDKARIEGSDPEITGITADSRQVQEGFLFVAIPGTQQDGRAFIAEAVKRGAVAVVVPEDSAGGAPLDACATITTPDPRAALALIASRFTPRQPRRIAAVTGTSGKTSTAEFTRQIWSLNTHPAASLGTLGLITPTESHYGSLTTPDPVSLHHTLDSLAAQNITHLAMEASSHSLDQHRLDYVKLQAAGFTNLSRDHLDYHATMDDYLAAKLRLFTHVLPEGCCAVLNADIPEFGELHHECHTHNRKILSYGQRGHDIKLHGHRPHPQGQVMTFAVLGKDYEILLPIIGDFQVWNSLCALGMAIASGEDAARCVTALQNLQGVPGRLQFIGTSAQGGSVFVDYAHKPGALEHVLTALRPHVTAHDGARLHVVFGCGGNRDKGKRPLMGSIAQRLADVVIVTDDNPRREEPATIRQEILAGCAGAREIGDRAQAIHQAIADLRKGDVLVIAGKGHEPGQIVGDQVLPFDDAEVARGALGV